MARMGLSSFPRSPFGSFGGLGGTTSTPIRVLIALAPITIPVAYMVYLQRSLVRHTAASALICPPDSLSSGSSADGTSDNKEALPSDVRHHLELYVVARERVASAAVPVSSLRPEFISKKGNLSGLLDSYVGATMAAFSWTPQALLLARMGAAVADPEAYRRSFDADYLAACRFRPGDRVCGVYVVRSRSRSKGRVVLDLAPPEGWTGPVVGGVLVVGFDIDVDRTGRGRRNEREREREGKGKGGGSGKDEGEGEIRFVNETVMWREKEGGKATLLEGWVGRWFHTMMARWLVVKGVEAVTGGKNE
ncbi:hypothetical protein F4813DRAFT_398502 [Daldinia decipiens]|uniref:uncharacterized protein n=1 Tax=Daldinia decipiens TaxID=326647 RepID=UPI0020C2B347|nr:uncharacterized protein F4813DRAFT_398502 [Daldinia decipiens]KAI1655404.1 hypothetical protein F4813DRAFT_398502 [Daldinia decipiens]